MENWKPVVGFEGLYEVSDLGRVRSLDRLKPAKVGRGGRGHKGRVLKLYSVKGLYQQASLSGAGYRRKVCVHILVAEAFIGPRPKGYHACHNDGDPTNNRAKNIRYDTVQSNSRDRIIHGTMLRGEAHPNAKLSDYDVAAIRVLTSAGFECRYVAKLYGVEGGTISSIKNMKSRVAPASA